MLGALFIYTNFVLHSAKIDFPRTVSSVVVIEKKYDQHNDPSPKQITCVGAQSYFTEAYNIKVQN